MSLLAITSNRPPQAEQTRRNYKQNQKITLGHIMAVSKHHMKTERICEGKVTCIPALGMDRDR
jgi:hypothetical protein